MKAIATIEFFFLLSEATCGPERYFHLGRQRGQQEKQTDRMWKGIHTTYEKHPYFAIITYEQMKSKHETSCGGAFITPQIVITAAHCLEGHRRDRLGVRYGTSKGEHTDGHSKDLGKGIDVKISGLYIYPEYRNITEADLALVRLQKPIKHTDFLIRLPESQENDWDLVGKFNVSVVAMGLSYGNDPGLIMKEGQVGQLRSCSWNSTCCSEDHAMCYRAHRHDICRGMSHRRE